MFIHSPYRTHKALTIALCCALGIVGSLNAAAQELANPNSYILPKGSKPKNNDTTAMDKYKSDYQQLSTSFKAITQALKRESDKAKIDNSDTIAKAEANAARAAEQARAKHYDKAYDILYTNFDALKNELVKLENSKGLGNNSVAIDATQPPPSADIAREQLEQELKTSATLLDALKRQNKEKSGGKDSQISDIEQTANSARNALNNGDVERAQQLIQDANSRTKAAIASMQSNPTTAPDTTTKISSDPSELQESYNKRKESTVALLNAGKRIDDERKTQHPTFEKAEGLISDADKLAEAGQLDEAKNTLDKAYTMVQNEMRNMMGRKKGEKKPSHTPNKKTSQHTQH